MRRGGDFFGGWLGMKGLGVHYTLCICACIYVHLYVILVYMYIMYVFLCIFIMNCHRSGKYVSDGSLTIWRLYLLFPTIHHTAVI